jgi:hypothetical protein
MEEEKVELPFPIEDLPTFSEPLTLQEEILQTYFEEPLKEPTVLLDTPFGEVLENFQEPVPFEVPLPFEEIPTEELYVERPADIAPSFECFVQKQASYGLLDGKYLIRY